MDLSQSRRQVENYPLTTRWMTGSLLAVSSLMVLAGVFYPSLRQQVGDGWHRLMMMMMLGTQGFLHLVLGADGAGRLKISLVKVFAASFASSWSTILWYLIMY